MSHRGLALGVLVRVGLSSGPYERRPKGQGIAWVCLQGECSGWGPEALQGSWEAGAGLRWRSDMRAIVKNLNFIVRQKLWEGLRQRNGRIHLCFNRSLWLLAGEDTSGQGQWQRGQLGDYSCGPVACHSEDQHPVPVASSDDCILFLPQSCLSMILWVLGTAPSRVLCLNTAFISCLSLIFRVTFTHLVQLSLNWQIHEQWSRFWKHYI